MLVWPNRASVEAALRAWAARELPRRPEVQAFGFFGSYARGNWGVGSDLDVVAVVSHDTRPFTERALNWDLSELPVAAELLVYTRVEWDALPMSSPGFAREIRDHVVWVHGSA